METEKILLIDDYLPLREVLAIMLRDEGYEVVEADNGQVALDMLLSEEQNCPSCIVLDVKMPVMNGNEFLNRLEREKNQMFKNIPVIVYSADGEMGQHDQIKARLEKPISIELLISAIKGNIH